MSSLAAFAKANPRWGGCRCFICNLPEREEIDRNRAAGVSAMTICDWLVHEKGRDGATRNKVNGHFVSGHHEPAHAKRCKAGAQQGTGDGKETGRIRKGR